MMRATMDGVLRKATAADIDAILALIAAHPAQLLRRRRAEIEQLLRTFWVIEEEGRVVGCVCLEVYSPKIAEVRSLAVLEPSRGRRYGARLVEAAVAEARRRRIPQVLVVTSNVDFFRRMNFQPCLKEKYALFWEPPGRAPGKARESVRRGRRRPAQRGG
jgi:N-acetylglutamate synthase-like GNAT family acetyltransferase